MKKLKDTFQDIIRYPSAIVGLLIVLALIVFSIYTMITIPYKEAIYLWKGTEEVVYKNPRNAQPTWSNWFRKDKLPESIDVYAGEDESFTKEVTPREKGGNQIEFNYELDYNYNELPQDIFMYFTSNYTDRNPFIVITMITPSGEEIKVFDGGISQASNIRFGQEEKLLTRLIRLHGRDTETQSQLKGVIEGLFTKIGSYPPEMNKGKYVINVKATTFEEGSNVDAELVMHGTVFGLFGTDHMRRDLKVAIMWGAPIALAFGLTAALGTALISMFIAALGTWFGGWLGQNLLAAL